MGRDPAEITGKRRDLELGEAIKKKYKLEKNQRGYVITIIQDKGVRIATHPGVGKVMKKCPGNGTIFWLRGT